MALKFSQQLSLKKRIAFFSFLFICFIVLMGFFFILPSLKNIKETEKEMKSYMAEIEKYVLNKESLIDLDEQLKEIGASYSVINEIFNNLFEEVEFITSLENIAKNNSVEQRIDLIEKGKQEEGEETEIKEKKLVINILGGFENLINYLRDLEKSDNYINITDIEIIKGENESQVILTLTANTYWK